MKCLVAVLLALVFMAPAKAQNFNTPNPPKDVLLWAYPGQSAVPWNLVGANSIIQTTGTTTRGFQEAFNAALTSIGTEGYDLDISGGDNATGGAKVAQLGTTLSIPAAQGKRVRIGSVTLNSNSGVGANPGIAFDSQEMMEFELKGGQHVYQGTSAGSAILFKPGVHGTPLDGLHTIGDSSFWFTAPAAIAFDFTANAGTGTGATNNYFDFGELNYSNAQNGTAAGGSFFVPSVAASQNFTQNIVRSRHVHGVVGTGTVWKVGNGAPAGGQLFGQNMYQLNIDADSSTGATGIDTYESNSFYLANINGITSANCLRAEAASSKNIFIIPFSSCAFPGANMVDNGTGNWIWANGVLQGGTGTVLHMLGNSGLGKETNPQTQVVISENVTTGLSFPAGTILGLAGVDGTGALIDADSYNNGTAVQGGSLNFRTARGTAALPTASQPNDVLGAIGFRGYGSAFDTANSARIAVFALNAHSVTDASTYMTLETTPSASLVRATALTIQASGGISVGTTTDPGIGAILANTSITSPIVYGGSATGSTLTLTDTSNGAPAGNVIVKAGGGVRATFGGTTASNGTLNVGPCAISTNIQLWINGHANCASTSPAAAGIDLQISGPDAGGGQAVFDAFGSFNQILMRRADGTAASRTGLVANDVIMALVGLGWTSAGGYTAGSSTFIKFTATETWSGTAAGSMIQFATTPNTTQAIAIAATMNASGGMWIGGTNVDKGTNNLGVQGTVTVAGIASTAQADVVCTTAAGLLTYQVSATGCATSSERFKNMRAPLSRAEIEHVALGLVEAKRWTYKDPEFGDPSEYVGFTAEQIAAIDDRFITRDEAGLPYAVKHQQLAETAIAGFAMLLQDMRKENEASRLRTRHGRHAGVRPAAAGQHAAGAGAGRQTHAGNQ